MEPSRASWMRLGGVLEASWGLLEVWNGAPWWHACGTPVARWRARRGLLLGSIMIFRNYKDHYKEHKEGYEEGNKDHDFMRVWDSVRHAEAQGLARRIYLIS